LASDASKTSPIPEKGVIRTDKLVPGQTRTLSLTLTGSSQSTVKGFGSYQNIPTLYPNDGVQLDLYNAVERYLETNPYITTHTLTSQTVTVNVEQDLIDLGYRSGLYNVEYSFIRNYLGSNVGHKLEVQEISSNGLEVRVIPVASTTLQNQAFNSFFGEGFFQLPKSNVLPNLFLFKDSRTFVPIFDYVQDKFTVTGFPYSIIFKLKTPAANTLRIGDLVWLGQELDEKLVDKIIITPPRSTTGVRTIGSPNWDILAKQSNLISTEYKDWDDLLSATTSSAASIRRAVFSGSIIENARLNIDFRKFENYVYFGSAVERIENFKYKLKLIEFYDQRIYDLTTGLAGSLSASVSESSVFRTNVIDAQTKKFNLIGNFDSYEQYLYFQSSSYESSSYGEFYPTTWPKANSVKPFLNYSVTSSQAEEWFNGALSSASLYDANNPYALTKLTPAHIVEDSSNDQYTLFVSMIGHYFDLIYAYVKQMSYIYNRDQSLFDGFSRDIIYNVAQGLGIDFDNGSSFQDLWEYVLGENSAGAQSSIYRVSSEDRVKEIWKRIINNLPYLLKTKGTERGIRALINCYGIPQTILRIKEFGGPEPEFDSRTDYTYERFFYSTEVGTAASYSINVPWRQLREGTGTNYPRTVEIRVKMHPSQSADQTILQGPRWSVQAVDGSKLRLNSEDGGGNPISVTFTSSIYDGDFHHLALVGSAASLTLYDRKTNYQKVVSVVSGSLTSAVGYAFGGTLQIPGTSNPFSGSVQELRYWSSSLVSRILDNHALAPTSFQGNDEDLYTGSTSSFDDLAFRLTLGADNNKVNYALTSSISSSHPNQNITTFSSGQQKIATFVNYTNTASIAHVEIHSLEWPDLGANRSVSNKIRIDPTFVAGETQLFRNTSVVRSTIDNNPPDSPRLGVYFSPTHEVNQDIAEQFGGLSIDDYIGDPSYYELGNYPALDQLKHQYVKKYKARNNTQAYIRLLRHYDASLFQLIKKLVPYRANTQVGLVVESTILDRNKIVSNAPSYEQLHWSSSITIPDIYTPGGFVQDGDGEPFRNMQGYVEEGVIEVNGTDYIVPGGFVQDADGEPFRNIPGYVQEGVVRRSEEEVPSPISPQFEEVEYDYVIFDETIHMSPSLTGETDQFRKPLLDFTGSSAGFQFGTAEDTIYLRESGYGRDLAGLGSQYTFFTYATSGSGPTRSEPYLISSSRYDYSDPIGVVILDNRRSEISNDASYPYDQDIFGGKGFAGLYTSSYSISLTSSAERLLDPWTSRYGLRIDTPSSHLWKLSNDVGLHYVRSGSLYSSCSIDAFFYKQQEPWTHDLLYSVRYRSNRSAIGLEPADRGWKLYFGAADSPYSSSADYEILSTGNFNNEASIITRASGPQLWMEAAVDGLAAGLYVALRNLSVRCLNYRAQVQDYHLHDSAGMVNARYNGCKMTSADWNIDSPDTVDGGPVVTITLGGGTDLLTRPTARGTFEVRGTTNGGRTTTTATRLAPTNRQQEG
jgi:hypothetical protein